MDWYWLWIGFTLAIGITFGYRLVMGICDYFMICVKAIGDWSRR